MSSINERTPFVGIKVGDLVLVQSSMNPSPTDTSWWIGWIVGAPDQFNLMDGSSTLKVIDTNSGEIRDVNAEQTTRLNLAGMESNKVVPLVRSC
jgi:hypothetical protein|tara:strand:- start:180 stop:461 length:282 start_codon:yes stop_codon:yes gene_type:complete